VDPEACGRAIEAHRDYIIEQTLDESLVIGAAEGADATGTWRSATLR